MSSSSQLQSDGQSAASSLSNCSNSSSPTSTSSSPVADSSENSGTASEGNVCVSSTTWTDPEPRRQPPARRSKRRKTRHSAGCEIGDGGGGGGGRRAGAGTAKAKKMVKNAREKERVRIVRLGYEGLSGALKGRVERGSGHFSKVRALAAAIRRIEELTVLTERVRQVREEQSSETSSSASRSSEPPEAPVNSLSPSDDSLPLSHRDTPIHNDHEKMSNTDDTLDHSNGLNHPDLPNNIPNHHHDMLKHHDHEALKHHSAALNHCNAASVEVVALPCSEISLSCEESMEPVAGRDQQANITTPPLLPACSIVNAPFSEMDYPSLLPTTAYFSYSSGSSDYTPSMCLGSYCNGTHHVHSTLPSSSSLSSSSSSSSSSSVSNLLCCSPELSSLPVVPAPLDAMPSPPYAQHCGQDVWLAIGCN